MLIDIGQIYNTLLSYNNNLKLIINKQKCQKGRLADCSLCLYDKRRGIIFTSEPVLEEDISEYDINLTVFISNIQKTKLSFQSRKLYLNTKDLNESFMAFIFNSNWTEDIEEEKDDIDTNFIPKDISIEQEIPNKIQFKIDPTSIWKPIEDSFEGKIIPNVLLEEQDTQFENLLEK